MKINEITSGEKVWLTLKNIEYDFNDAYTNILTAHKFDSVPVSLIVSYIDLIHSRMNRLFSEGFDINDPDIIRIRQMYEELSAIRNQL